MSFWERLNGTVWFTYTQPCEKSLFENVPTEVYRRNLLKAERWVYETYSGKEEVTSEWCTLKICVWYFSDLEKSA